MSTAQEIEIKAHAARQWLDKAALIIAKEMMARGTLDVFGREVCARRARVLRRRGELVRYTRRTARGKCRYVWAPVPFRLDVNA